MHPSPVCPSPGTVRHTCLLGASHPPRPAPSSSEVSQAAPRDATDAGKKHEVIFDFYGPLSPIKMLKAVAVVIRSSFILTRVRP